jgi:hypothetical protein
LKLNIHLVRNFDKLLKSASGSFLLFLLLERRGNMDWVVEGVGVAGNREEVHEVEGSGPLENSCDSTWAFETERNTERNSGQDQSSHVAVHALDCCLSWLIELILNFIQSNREDSSVDHEATEEHASWNSMKSSPCLVENTNHGKADHGNHTNVHHGIVAAIGDLSKELLVVSAKVNLLDAKHENGSEQEEGPVVHLLDDDIWDHGPFLNSALIVTLAIVTWKVEHDD